MVVYMTLNKVNGKMYIGMDSKNNPAYLGSGKILLSAIKKYGSQNFVKYVFEYCENRKQLCERERWWISLFGAVENDKFYNIANGGQGGELSELHSLKISESLKGHKLSEETKDKIRQKAIGRKASHSTRLLMSNVQRSINKDWLKKYTTGKDNPRAKPVAQYDVNGNLIKLWDYAQQAINELGMNRSDITNCLKGRQKTAKNFKWQYYDLHH